MAIWRDANRALGEGGEWRDAALDSQRVWQTILALHTASLGLLAMLALFPFVGEDHLAVAAVLAVVGLPFSLAMQWMQRRSGMLSPILPFGNVVIACVVCVIAPQLLPAVLIVMVATIAFAAAAFGVRMAMICALITTAAVGVIYTTAMAEGTANWGTWLMSFGLVSGSVAMGLGSLSEQQQKLRRRHEDLTSGIDAIVWEQVASRPTRLFVSKRAEDLLGYPTNAWLEPGFWAEHVHPDDSDRARRTYRGALRRGENLELDYRMRTADGSVIHLQDRMRVETDDFGRPTRVRGVMIDVTAEREAQQRAARYLDLVDNIHLALVVFGRTEGSDDGDDGLQVLAVNPEAASLLGLRPREAPGTPINAIDGLRDIEGLEDDLFGVLAGGQSLRIEEVSMNPAARGGPVFSLSAFVLSDDTVGVSLTDVTERVMAAQVLRRQALHDGLTGLPNRLHLTERLREVLTESKQTGQQVSLLLMDLDQFKEVNDALGHEQGDRLLIEVSRRLTKVVRSANMIARLGGDEFAVLLTGETDQAHARQISQFIVETLEQPFKLGGISLQTSASIGIAVHPEHADDPESLAQRADVAMYVAKRHRRGIEVYAPEYDESSVRRLALLGELRRAIDEDQLILHFQPTLDLRSGAIVGCESLVRWEHPEHGLMPPGEFIELAEVSGLIQPLTRWVVDAAFDQIDTWSQAGRNLMVSVNLSVRNLYDREFVSWLHDAISEHAVPANRLKIEITESELMDDPLFAMDVLGRLKEAGAATSIDDFGTGYSSLAYLKHLPIDELKIDRSFVGNMTTDDSDLTIVRSTVDLAHNLGLSVVAEGVEDGATLGHLAGIGCDRVQGYFVSRPVPPEAFDEFLADSSRLAEVCSHLPAAAC